MEERQISKSRMKPQRPSILGLAGRLYPGFSLSKKVEATKDSEFIHTALLALVEKSRQGAGKGVFGRESFTQARVGILRAQTQGKPLHQGNRHRRVTAHGGFRVLGISTWMKEGDGSVERRRRTIIGILVFVSLPEQVLGEHFFAVEVEVASESATCDDAGEPVDVVGPHFVVGDAV